MDIKWVKQWDTIVPTTLGLPMSTLTSWLIDLFTWSAPARILSHYGEEPAALPSWAIAFGLLYLYVCLFSTMTLLAMAFIDKKCQPSE